MEVRRGDEIFTSDYRPTTKFPRGMLARRRNFHVGCSPDDEISTWDAHGGDGVRVGAAAAANAALRSATKRKSRDTLAPADAPT
jgi:hypothetical protein